MPKLSDKVTLITGGGTDIARATAALFSAHGARVILTDKNETKTQFEQVALDLTGDSGLDTLHKFLTEKNAAIDILINVAAVGGAPLANTDPAFFRSVLEINTVAPLKLSRYVADDLIARKQPGSIINITTVHASIPNTDPAYSASKAALLALTKSLALSLAPYGIRVNSVAPGAISGGMNSALTPREKDHITKEIPLAHFGTPEDIAETVLFLSSEQSNYITGQDIKVDGGLTLADASFNR